MIHFSFVTFKVGATFIFLFLQFSEMFDVLIDLLLLFFHETYGLLKGSGLYHVSDHYVVEEMDVKVILE